MRIALLRSVLQGFSWLLTENIDIRRLNGLSNIFLDFLKKRIIIL